MPAEISLSLALELISWPAVPPIARPLAQQGASASTDSAALALQGIYLFAIAVLGLLVKGYNRAIAALAVAARFPGANADGGNDGNDDGNDQEIGQNDGNDGNDSRIDLAEMDDLGDTSPSGFYSLSPRAARVASLACQPQTPRVFKTLGVSSWPTRPCSHHN